MQARKRVLSPFAIERYNWWQDFATAQADPGSRGDGWAVVHERYDRLPGSAFDVGFGGPTAHPIPRIPYTIVLGRA